MKPCSSNYARTSKPQKVAANSARGSQLSTPSHTLATGKDGVHAIVACARIFSICDGALSSTICMSWLTPRRFLLSFRTPLDYLTDALEEKERIEGWVSTLGEQNTAALHTMLREAGL